MQTLVFEVQNEQHSKEIQDAIFALNGGWRHVGCISQEYEHTDKSFLHIYASHTEDGGRQLELMWADTLNKSNDSFEELGANAQRRMAGDLSTQFEVNLDNFKDYFNKIDFKTEHQGVSK